MADDKKHTYDESKVKTLSSIEHIRLRTGRSCPSVMLADYLITGVCSGHDRRQS